MDTQFEREVLAGLSAFPKSLPSKYFYDKKGDALFQEIMALDEYYLTRAEYDILDAHKGDMLGMLKENGHPFQLIEFGAGDGMKTKVLLDHFLQENANFQYLPIDISANALQGLSSDLQATFPELEVRGLQGDYFAALKDLNTATNGNGAAKKIVLFLGSNIGNFTHDQAVEFLKKLAINLNDGDGLLIGMDLKKDPKRILDAYNDKEGVTRDFNLNLLQRINDELGADFDLEHYIHYPVYEPLTGMAKSFLVSTQNQVVAIPKLNATIHFEAWEAVHMEISRKFGLGDINRLAKESGFKVVKNFFDGDELFVDSLWEKV